MPPIYLSSGLKRIIAADLPRGFLCPEVRRKLCFDVILVPARAVLSRCAAERLPDLLGITPLSLRSSSGY
jgi:hypothetical protein